MIRYTTPTIRIAETGSDLSQYDKLFVTISQLDSVITKEPTVEGSVMSITLTQEESARFRLNYPCEVIVNAMKGEKRYASNVMPVPLYKNLLNEVIDGA